ncbi:MAG: hypothetical protein JWQ11_4674 [Rhizobacter sp.]|nr:hypothetical protein [Rhizobacter sp.]
MTLAITCRWAPSVHESPEVRETGANLTIALGQALLTRNVDEWSRTVKDDVRVSAYPMALWLVSNWWRLRWEPLLATAPTLSWRMSHELAAAGYGYVWPKMLFVSDGEAVQIWAASSTTGEPSPVNYLTEAHGVVSADHFEKAIDRFFSDVVLRLESVGISATPLQSLVMELAEERADPDLAAYRRLEALAGFDAGEGSAEVLNELEALVSRAGSGAAQEMATLCVPDRSGQVFTDAIRVAGEPGLPACPTAFALVTGAPAIDLNVPAWMRGKNLALAFRRRLGLNDQPIMDKDLHDIMGVASQQVKQAASQMRLPFGLAVREASGRLVLHPRRLSATGFRFELARYLGDHAMAGEGDHWLPVTASKTARQRAQRAFAAEFLCPIDSLKSYMNDDLSDDAIENAANHFKVGPLAVRAQLVNYGLVPRESMSDLSSESLFSYRID